MEKPVPKLAAVLSLSTPDLPPLSPSKKASQRSRTPLFSLHRCSLLILTLHIIYH